MDEYINKYELLKVIGSNVAESPNERCSQLLEAILNAPAVDVVPKSELDQVRVELDAMRGAAKSFKMHYELIKKDFDTLKSLITQKEDEAYSKGYEDAQSDMVLCKDCKHLELNLPYAVCSEGHKGFVQPDDSCEHGARKDEEDLK